MYRLVVIGIRVMLIFSGRRLPFTRTISLGCAGGRLLRMGVFDLFRLNTVRPTAAAFSAPDALNPVLAYPPAADPQQCGDPTIAISTILGSKSDNGLGQRVLVSTSRRDVALGAPRLADDPAGMSLR
jgi:hypothetical protein